MDRRTIVFILADHGVPMGEHHDNYMLVNYLYEEGLRIPLLILAPGRLKKPAVIDDLGSQVDLLPTVMDLFGMTGVNHAVGTSLVRRVQERTVYFNNPFALQYLGLRRGNLKYVETLLSGTSSVYDLDADPHERHDLAAELPEFAAQSRAAAIAVNQLFLHLYLRGRIAQPHSARATTN